MNQTYRPTTCLFPLGIWLFFLTVAKTPVIGQQTVQERFSDIFYSSLAAHDKIDSLLPMLEQGKIERSMPDSVIKYAILTTRLCAESGRVSLQAEALLIQGEVYGQQLGEIKKAETCLLEAGKIFRQQNIPVWAGVAAHYLGQLYDYSSQYYASSQAYEEAINLYRTALKETKRNEDEMILYLENELSKLLLHRGISLRKLGVTDSAKATLLLALDKKQQLKDAEGIILTHSQLAMIFRDQAVYSEQKGAGLDSALHYLEQAFQAFEQVEGLDSVLLADCYLVEASIREAKKDFQQALKSNQAAFAIYQQQNDSSYLLRASNNLGYDLFHLRRFAEAEQAYREALLYLNSAEDERYQFHIYQNLSDLFKYQGKEEQALEYIDKGEAAYHHLIQESEWNGSPLSLQQFEQFRTIRDHLLETSALKENYRQKRNQYRYSFLSTLLIVLLILWGIWTRHKQQKRLHKHQILTLVKGQEEEVTTAFIEGQEQEREQIAEELHDHFLGNLAACKTFVEIMPLLDSDPNNQAFRLQKKVIDLLDETYHQARLLSHKLKHSVNSYSYGDFFLEIEDLLENLRLKNIKVEVQSHGASEEEIRYRIAFHIKRILQEIITNIIKYAEASSVQVVMDWRSKFLNIRVSDNGKGFHPNVKREGIGIRNMKKRTHHLQGEIQIHSSPGRGTTTDLHIPKSTIE